MKNSEMIQVTEKKILETDATKEENKLILYVFYFMVNLNFILVLFISGLMCYTIYGEIISSCLAKDFLEQINTLPMVPWKIPVISISAFLLLLLNMYFKNKNKLLADNLLLVVIIEIILCTIVTLCLSLSYNGVILLIIADLVPHSKNTRVKILVLGLVFLCFVFADYDLIVSKLHIISFQTYLDYYNTSTRNVFLVMKNILSSVNMLSFMAYMILLITMQIQKNERMNLLNEELNSANEQLQQANNQLEIYAKTTEKMTETRERNRLAREIHDTLGHSLTGMIAGIDACITMIDYSTDLTKQQLKTIGDVARQGMKDVRRSVKALRPDALERLDLKTALEQMIAEMRTTAGADITFCNEIKVLKFNEDEENMIYRIVQECITNAIRHGKADKIYIHMYREYDKVTLQIKDNGIGCKDVKIGFGLQHMKERLEMLNGILEYDGSNGFMIQATIPIRWGGNYD